MLPLRSKMMPIVTGASSVEKLLITCPILLSYTWKFSRSSPVTSRFIGSVTVAGTSTRFTSTRIRASRLEVASAAAFSAPSITGFVLSGVFGGGGGGWVCTSPSGFSCARQTTLPAIPQTPRPPRSKRPPTRSVATPSNVPVFRPCFAYRCPYWHLCHSAPRLPLQPPSHY